MHRPNLVFVAVLAVLCCCAVSKRGHLNGIWTTPGGDKVAWFTDPDGNNVSLTQFV